MKFDSITMGEKTFEDTKEVFRRRNSRRTGNTIAKKKSQKYKQWATKHYTEN